MTTLAAALDQALRAVCPIKGVSIGDGADRDSWSIDFSDDASDGQKKAATALLSTWVAPTYSVESVSARQFKLQLLAAGLLDQVDAWIATQPKAVQIAYEYSGTFVRTEPMMAAGFAAMGFTEEQIDDFFTAASAL